VAVSYKRGTPVTKVFLWWAGKLLANQFLDLYKKVNAGEKVPPTLSLSLSLSFSLSLSIPPYKKVNAGEKVSPLFNKPSLDALNLRSDVTSSIKIFSFNTKPYTLQSNPCALNTQD